MDSGLEAFLRKHEKPRNAREPAVVKKLRESKQKKYIAAENLANAVVKKREALEARSNLFNAGPMHISGSGVNYMQAIPENSALDNIHPGLVQMRAHEIKRRGPTIKDLHDTKTHELLGKLETTISGNGYLHGVRHEELLETLKELGNPVGRGALPGAMAGGSGGKAAERGRSAGRSSSSESDRGRFRYGSSVSREASVASQSAGEGILTPMSRQQRDATLKRPKKPRGVPDDIWDAHGRDIQLTTEHIKKFNRGEPMPTRDEFFEKEKIAHRLVREARTKGKELKLQNARGTATRLMNKSAAGAAASGAAPGTPAPKTPAPSRPASRPPGRGRSYTPRGH
jgi:hypothetical protein